MDWESELSTAQSSYVGYVDLLSRHRQHLRCLRGFLLGHRGNGLFFDTELKTIELRHPDRLSLNVIDVELDENGETSIHSNTFPTTTVENGIESFFSQPPSELVLRNIVVERVTPEIIALLGRVYDVDPDFFHGHLETQAWEYVKHKDFDGGKVTTASRIRKKQYLHLDFEKLHPVRCNWFDYSSSPEHAERHDSRAVISELSTRLLAKGDIIPRMTMVHANSSTCDNIASLVSRERASFYSCTQNGVRIHIYLFFPRIASRRYQSFGDPHIIGNQLLQSHFYTPDPMPRFSEPSKWTSKPVNTAGHGLSRLFTTLLSEKDQYLDLENCGLMQPKGPSLFFYQIVASEWHITMDHFSNLMTALEDDRELLAPKPDDTSCRISLMQVRRLLLEYKDMIHDTLQSLQLEEIARNQPGLALMNLHIGSSRSGTSTTLNSVASSASGKSRISQIPPRRTPTVNLPESTFLESLTSDFLTIDRSIHILIDRANKAAASHMSFLAIEESRRAIEQAEVVRRLTSLAFFFIPLTFTTGIFGMNVKGLQIDGVSPWIPVVLAVLVTSVTLALNWFSGRQNSNRSIFAKIEEFQKSFQGAEPLETGTRNNREKF